MNYKQPEKIALQFLVYLFAVPSMIGAVAAWYFNDITIVSIAVVGGLCSCLFSNIVFALLKRKLIVREFSKIAMITASEAPVSFFVNLVLYVFLVFIFGLTLFSLVAYY